MNNKRNKKHPKNLNNIPEPSKLERSSYNQQWIAIVISLLIGGASLLLSYQSNQKSDNALRISDKTFQEQFRPRLNVDLKNILFIETKDGIHIKQVSNIRNTGSSIAKRIGAHLMNCEFEYLGKNYRNGGRELDTEKDGRNLQPGEAYENFGQPCPISISDQEIRKRILQDLFNGKVIIKFKSLFEYEDDDSSNQCTRTLEFEWRYPEASNIKNPETCIKLKH